jgi:hypothetical protein
MSTRPRTTEVMRDFLRQARTGLPLGLAADDICTDDCRGCSMKLIEYLESEIENWEYRLQQGDVPDFRDLDRFARSATRIHRVLVRNGLVEAP